MFYFRKSVYFIDRIIFFFNYVNTTIFTENMHNDFTEQLQEIGLTKNEARIYTSLLSCSKMTVSEIARATNIKRATCYQYLDALLSQGFIVRVPIGKRMFYSPVNPKKILTAARKRYATFEKVVENMTKQYEESTHKPRVFFYEGKREIKHIYEDLFKTIGDVYSIFPPKIFFENFTEQEYDDFDSSISQHALKSKDLIVGDTHFRKVEEIRKKNGMKNKITKKLPESFTSTVDVLIYNDSVALISLRDLSALVIENKEIATVLKNMHALIWKSV